MLARTTMRAPWRTIKAFAASPRLPTDCLRPLLSPSIASLHTRANILLQLQSQAAAALRIRSVHVSASSDLQLVVVRVGRSRRS